MTASVVSGVVQRVGDLVIQEAAFLSGVPRQVESMKVELWQIQCFLNVVDAKCMEGNEVMKNLACEIREVAYQVEEVIDIANSMSRRRKSAVSKYAHILVDSAAFHKVGKTIEEIRSRISSIFERFKMYGIVNPNNTTEGQTDCLEDEALRAQRIVSPDLDEKVDIIGFDLEIKKIRNDLLDPENMGLTVVSIVGPAGAGKSTLAKVIYSSVVSEGYFHRFGWVSISPKYVVLDLLRSIVKQIMGTGKESEKKAQHLNILDQNAVAAMLRDFLGGERYLIVLDDMWTMDTWDKLKSAFPDTGNGSRIILTTRIMEVGEHPKMRRHICIPALLDDADSWELFCKKAFQQDAELQSGNLDELKRIGRTLATKCNGLPLALVVLGGFLSQKRNVRIWKKMAAGIDWEAMRIEGDVGRILALTYHNMSNNLRSCFLYTASLPEDYQISVRVLKRVWIAEGFVPHVRGYTPQEMAYRYVEDLAQRCMIQVEDRSKNLGWIKRIKVHDVLRDWAVGQARREGFLKACSSRTDVETVYSDELRSYRAALHHYFDKEVGTSLPNLRSLLVFNPDGEGLFSFQGLSFLRVLHFHGSCNRCALPKEINRLVHLRYLGLEGNGVFMLPSSIKGLVNLQTLEAGAATIKTLPTSLWSIPLLKHVHVYRVLHWSAVEVRRQSSLQTLYVFSIMHCDPLSWKATVRSLEKLNQHVSWCLGKLSTMLARDIDPEEDKADSLEVKVDTLESQVDGLEMFGCYKELYVLNDVLPNSKLFPRFLLKLKIACPHLLNEDPMPILEMLPRLEVLELSNLSYTGTRMTCSSHGFLALRDLILEGLDLEEWSLEQGSMALLATMTLSNCTKLRTLPDVLNRLDDLVVLRLTAMPQLSEDDHEIAKRKGCSVLISS